MLSCAIESCLLKPYFSESGQLPKHFSSIKKPKLSVLQRFAQKARIFERIFTALRSRSGVEDITYEKMTEVINVLSKTNESFVKEFKKELIEIFESDEFFKCNINTLKVFSRLIDRFLDVTKYDILTAHFETFLH